MPYNLRYLLNIELGAENIIEEKWTKNIKGNNLPIQ